MSTSVQVFAQALAGRHALVVGGTSGIGAGIAAALHAAGAVVSLCTDAAAFVTGVVLPVDGGYLIN